MVKRTKKSETKETRRLRLAAIKSALAVLKKYSQIDMAVKAIV